MNSPALPVVRRALRSLTLLLACGLTACATAPMRSAPAPGPFFDDDRFAADRFSPDPEAPLALTPEMDRFLHERIAPQLRARGPLYGLVDALYADDQLRLGYDAAATLTAAETFAQRRGNCLSLVLMTAAFAQRLGLEVRFQRVLTEDAPEPAGDLVRMVGHVNLGLAKRGTARVRDWITVDFLPGLEAARLRTVEISEDRVKAMFFNNLAVESLGRGELPRAYWWARAASRQDPRLASPYVTLGVLWSRLGEAEPAGAAFRQALALEPRNESALANLTLDPASASKSARADANAGPGHPGVVAQALAALKRQDPERARQILEQGAADGAPLPPKGLMLKAALASQGGQGPQALALLREAQRAPGLEPAQRQWVDGKLQRLQRPEAQAPTVQPAPAR